MATKPATTPRLWGTNPLYTTGPFIGQPGKVDPGIGVAAEGHRPGANFPTPAEFENYQQDRLTDWTTNWLALGTFDPDPDAHVVETDGTGRAGVHGLDVINTVDEIAMLVTGVNTLVPTALFQCSTGAAVVQADFGNTSGTGFITSVLANPGTGYSATLLGTASGGAGVRITTDAACGAPAVDVAYNGIGRGMRLVNTGPNVECINVDSLLSPTAIGINVRVGGPTPAIQARSGPVTGSAFRGFLDGPNGFTVHATTGAASLVGARAGLFAATGEATGVEASAIGNAGGGNPNAAIRTTMQAGVFAGSELHLTGRAGDSTSTSAGRINHNTVTGTVTISDVSVGEQKDLHASRGGLVLGPGTTNGLVTSNSAAVWSLGATLTLTGLNAPRRAGVRVTLLAYLEARSPAGIANGIVDVAIFDETDDPVVPKLQRTGGGFGLGAGYLLAEATTSWQRAVALPFQYTIPAAGDRTFSLKFKTSTANSVQARDLSLVPIGAYG